MIDDLAAREKAHLAYIAAPGIIPEKLNAAISAYLAARAEQGWVEVQGWQPIETAPKDWKPVLVGFQGQFEWVNFTAMANGPDTQNHAYARPTHWMPLPIPPASQPKGDPNADAG